MNIYTHVWKIDILFSDYNATYVLYFTFLCKNREKVLIHV